MARAPQGPPANLAGPHNHIGEHIPARKITALAEGRYEIDFGTNLTGWLHLKFPPLKAGQLIRLRFADRMFANGVHTSPRAHGYGDGQVALQGMMMNFDSADFYSKWVRDWRLALEKKDERLPYITPPFVKTGGGPPWPGNIARIPCLPRLRREHRVSLRLGENRGQLPRDG